MSEHTYYVPELKDLREGFKFELQVYDETTDEYHTFTEGRVRALDESLVLPEPFYIPKEEKEDGKSENHYQLNPLTKVYKMEDNILPPGVEWDMLGAFIKKGEAYNQYLNFNDRVLLIEGSEPFPITKAIFEKLFVIK